MGNEILIINAKQIAKEILIKANITEVNSNISFLLQHATKLTNAQLLVKKTLTKKEFKTFIKLVKKRAKHKPLQHIVGFTEFMGNTIYVNKNVLVPRFETEELTEIVINYLKNNNLENCSVLDLCCGSGCIGLGVKKHVKNANVTLADVSKKALKVAKKNATANGLTVEIIKSNMFKNITTKFNVIVCNPPYIKNEDRKTLSKEVLNYDPNLALFGGDTGLNFYNIIANNACVYLENGGALFLEYGENQENDIKNALKTHFKCIKIIKDYYGTNRFIFAIKKEI